MDSTLPICDFKKKINYSVNAVDVSLKVQRKPRSLRRLTSSVRKLCHVTYQTFTDVLEEHSASTFRVEESAEQASRKQRSEDGGSLFT
jgi:hypothetical protein